MFLCFFEMLPYVTFSFGLRFLMSSESSSRLTYSVSHSVSGGGIGGGLFADKDPRVFVAEGDSADEGLTWDSLGDSARDLGGDIFNASTG